MQGSEPREAVLECAARDGDIAEGALWLAADDCPGVEPDRWLERLDELASDPAQLLDQVEADVLAKFRPPDVPVTVR